MIDKLIFVLTQKLAVLFVIALSTAGGFLATTSGHNAAVNLPQIAIISSNDSSNIPSAAIIPSSTIGNILPGLLPTTTIQFCTASSTCGMKGIRILIKTAAAQAQSSQVEKKSPQTASIINTASLPAESLSEAIPNSQPTQTPTTATTAATATPAATAQSLLANATLALKETRTGSYEVTVNSTEPDSAAISWNIGAQTVGTIGASAAPQFASAFSCDPASQVPAPGAPDQNPLFETDTAYTCTLSLTPLSGNNLQTQSKNFSFTTPAGQLFVTAAANVDTLLGNNTNNGGIVFDNEDASSVTITGLTLDVSYAYLDTLNGPLVLRILDPATNKSLFDYHLENLPNDQADINASLSFTIPGASQKMLPIQILGVQRMLAADTTPSVQVTLQDATTNRSEVKVTLASPQASWSCVVPSTGYDPNATSGPFATGQACGN